MKNPIGVLINCGAQTDYKAEFRKARDLDLTSCQLSMWSGVFTDEMAQRIREASAETGLTVTAVWAGWSGPAEWNFTYGPSTIGLVPPAYRFQRMQEIIAAADFAKKIGVDKIITHVGFIPENPDHSDFQGTVGALRAICRHLKAQGQYFLFETGQETPVTMLRTIQAIGLDNIGINFDTANLILYGKANTLDALDVFGKYVMDTHIKDGLYPTDGMSLGRETKAGAGRADIPAVVKKLRQLGYEGAFTIEREITGEQQILDIVEARDLLRRAMDSAD